MIEYKINVIKGRRLLPSAEFEDEKYALLGEFLLAERSFLRKAAEFLKTSSKRISFNVFSLEKSDGSIIINNDVSGKSLTVGREDFAEVLNAYREKARELKSKKQV